MKKIIVMCIIMVMTLILSTHVQNAGIPNIKTRITQIESDVELLARLVYAEAGGESFEGQWAVADVVVYTSEVLNFPINRTILDSGRFDGIRSRMYSISTKDIPKSCIRAARRSLTGHHILPAGMWYFYNPRTATDTLWIDQISRHREIRIGNHIFCCRPRRMV